MVQLYYEFFGSPSSSQAAAFNRTHWDFYIHMICDAVCIACACLAWCYPVFCDSICCGWWTMLCIYHYFTCYLERYTINQVRLLMGDLSQYASMLILVLGSRMWLLESMYLVSTYWALCLAMAHNGAKNAKVVCMENFDLIDERYARCIQYFNA